MRSEGAVVKEMEAAAVAWVCQQLSVPFVAIKSITDIVDSNKKSEDEFYSNLVIASESLKIKLTSFINNLGGTSLDSWNSNEDDRIVQVNDNIDLLINDGNYEINNKHDNVFVNNKNIFTSINSNNSSNYDGNISMIKGFKIGVIFSIVTTSLLLLINSNRRK
jgi:hypothetical protein